MQAGGQLRGDDCPGRNSGLGTRRHGEGGPILIEHQCLLCILNRWGRIRGCKWGSLIKSPGLYKAKVRGHLAPLRLRMAKMLSTHQPWEVLELLTDCLWPQMEGSSHFLEAGTEVPRTEGPTWLRSQLASAECSSKTHFKIPALARCRQADF